MPILTLHVYFGAPPPLPAVPAKQNQRQERTPELPILMPKQGLQPERTTLLAFSPHPHHHRPLTAPAAALLEGLRQLEMDRIMLRQPEAEAGEMLMEMPSFRSICGGEEWPRPLLGGLDEAGSAGRPVGASEEDFEFWCVDSRHSLDGLELVAAEEVFSGGRIRPVSLQLHAPAVQCPGSDDANDDVNEDDAYAIGEVKVPVDFSLSLRVFLAGDEKLTSTSSSASSEAWSESSDELDSVPAKSYCLWAPRSAPESPDLCKKSHSVGAGSRKWRLLDLVTRRSHSDGKERFALVASPGAYAARAVEKKDKNRVEKKDKNKGEQQRTAAAREENKGKGAGRGGGKAVSGTDMEAAHRFYYMKGRAAAGDRRRSFLPYRKDLLGFFPRVNLAGRSIRAF